MALAHTVYRNIAEGTSYLDTRNDMIMKELPQVQYIASRILERLPQQVELCDLVNAGVIGLLEAYRAFDPTKNAQFSTFAKFRIRGAILDSLRALDWGSRSIRRRAREIAEVTSQLESKLGRSPSSQEVAVALGISLTSLNEIQKDLSSLFVVGQEVASSIEGGSVVDLIESAPSIWENPFEMYQKKEEKELLAKAISELPEREQLILSLYYVEELTMKEVAEVVGLATSRVSQIHSAALVKLRKALECDAPAKLANVKVGRSN